MKLVPLAMLAISVSALSACVTSAPEEREARAALACLDKPTEQERMKCRDTELADMTELERERYYKQATAVNERERREAIRQAYGIPKKIFRHNRGIPLPGEGS